MELSALLRGVVIGFSIAAPVGPIGVLCIRRTLANGRWSGLISGLGAATADAFYGSLAALGLSFLIDLLVNQQTWLQIIGGIFLCYLGLKTYFEKPAQSNLTATSVQDPAGAVNNSPKALLMDFSSTLMLTLTNPLTILSFAAIFAGLGISSQVNSRNQGLLLVVGVFLGSSTWWILLSTIASGLSARFMSPKILQWINRISGLVIASFGIIALAASLLSFASKIKSEGVQARLLSTPSPLDIKGFRRVTGPIPLEFPKDHGAHPDYLTEWWYFTGNLESPEGQHFGYQLTFFRRALASPEQTAERSSDWATTQAYMAHFTISDVQGGGHQAFEQLSRGAANLAGAEADPFRVWLYDWEVIQVSTSTYKLVARQDDLALVLTLEDVKGPVLQGERGYSQKSTEPGQASMYYSLTRLVSNGFLEIRNRRYQVNGLSWMDHEFSTSALSADQVGWDWFSFQLDDGSELMLFQIRRQDGTIDPFSSGTLIRLDGTTLRLDREDFNIQVMQTWKSSRSSAIYPAEWSVQIIPADIELRIQPYLADQELNVSYVYWEGCVQIEGKSAGRKVLGSGYVELTGYAGTMAGEF